MSFRSINAENTTDSKTLRLKKIYVCNNPLTRLRGIYFRGEFNEEHAVLLDNCCCVHGVGIRKPLDVVFLTRDNRVVAIKQLSPFGVCVYRQAYRVLELLAGVAKKLNIGVGDQLDFGSLCDLSDSITPTPTPTLRDKRRQSGSSMVEFLLVAPVLVYLGVGVVQIGMAYHARNILDYATFEAARVGAVNQADVGEMRGELAYRLGPIFPGNGTNDGVRSAVSDAIVAVNDPTRTHIQVINPTSAVFEDFGIPDPDSGNIVLPSSHLQHRSTEIGNSSGVSIQDANLLKIEVTHGYELRLPWFDISLPGVDFVLKELMAAVNPADAQYYLRGQIPLRAVATVRMQSDALENNVAAATPNSERADTDELIAMGSSIQLPAQGCVGDYGLPSNLTITTIHGDQVEGDGGCAILPPDTAVVDPPVC